MASFQFPIVILIRTVGPFLRNVLCARTENKTKNIYALPWPVLKLYGVCCFLRFSNNLYFRWRQWAEMHLFQCLHAGSSAMVAVAAALSKRQGR